VDKAEATYAFPKAGFESGAFGRRFFCLAIPRDPPSVDEIANMVVYVSSKEASATNGAALRAEGGIIQTVA
jgi:hypothetical protein